MNETPQKPPGLPVDAPERTGRVTFGWRVPFFDEHGKYSHLVVPHADPQEHEYPVDEMFDTVEAAQQYLVDEELAEEATAAGWFLVQIAQVVIGRASATQMLSLTVRFVDGPLVGQMAAALLELDVKVGDVLQMGAGAAVYPYKIDDGPVNAAILQGADATNLCLSLSYAPPQG